MAQSFRYISATSGYHPVASQYVISYSRRKDKYKLNQYTQLVEAPAPTFWYYELDRDTAVRVPNLAGRVWHDGADRPQRRDNQPGFRAKQETCIRFDWTSSVGNVALEMANKQWKAKTVYLEMLTNQAMTGRTLMVWKGIGVDNTTGGWRGLDTAAIWPSTSVADVNSLNGGAGTWDGASADPADESYMAIRKSLTEAAKRIFLNTNGVVEWKDLRLVVHPDVARAMGNSSEIREYYKYGAAPVDKALGIENMNAQYGLPPELYGIEVVVEDAMYIDTLPTAGFDTHSTDRKFIKNKTNAVLLSRQGKIDSQVGPSFSTFQLWYFGEQMTVEEYVDPKHRLTEFHIVDYYVPVAPALVSGFNITNVVPVGA